MANIVKVIPAPAGVSSTNVVYIPALGGTVVDLNSTQTLTNKTFTNATATGGTYTNATLTTPTITGGTATNTALTTPTVTNATVTGGTFTNTGLVTPTITGGTATNTALVTPTVTGGTATNTAIVTPTITGGTSTNTTLITPTITNATVTTPTVTIRTATFAAAGGNIATANAITTVYPAFILVTGADGTKGVQLPVAVAGASYVIKNSESANAILKVYPQANSQINEATANTALSMAANSCAEFYAYNTTAWYSLSRTPS